MIRVIHYCPSINCTSGITNLIMNYYRKIDRTRFQFDFIYFGKKTDNNFEKEIIELGGSVTYILPPTKPFKFRIRLKQYLTDLKKKYPEDMFIFQNHQIAFTVFMYNIIKGVGIDNIIVHNHMTHFSDSKIKAFRNMLLFVLSKKKDINYFSCSKYACKLLIKYAKVKSNDIFIMNNGIDCEKFKYNPKTRTRMRNELQLLDSFVIGHIGHFEPVKNHEFILKLFDRLYKLNSNYKLLLIGNGSLKHNFIKLIDKKTYKDNVIILSERKDISDLLNVMDCFIFPSKFEGLGIAAIEAQANGLPTFISDCVSSEVIISNCKQISLSDIADWEKQILGIKEQKREISYKFVLDSQFDINKNISFLENKYINMLSIEKR